MRLTETEALIAAEVLKEIRGRWAFSLNVGWTTHLNEPHRRCREANPNAYAWRADRSRVGGVLYILDEPSIGLHARDNQRLLDTLRRLRDMGNTVVVVEHDEETMRAADHIIDFGPGPGVRGGQVVAAARSTRSCAHRQRHRAVPDGQGADRVPSARRPAGDKRLIVVGAAHNT